MFPVSDIESEARKKTLTHNKTTSVLVGTNNMYD